MSAGSARQRAAMSRALLIRASRTVRSVRAVMASPPFVAPGHFFSLTTGTDRGRALTWSDAPGVDLAEERQLALAEQLRPSLAEPFPGPRYVAANNMYGPARCRGLSGNADSPAARPRARGRFRVLDRCRAR